MAVDHVERCAPFRMAVSRRQVALHDQTGAVFHQSMTHAAEYRAGAGGFLVTARIGVGGRAMGGLGPLRALEIDFGIAVGFGGAGHRIGLGGGLGRCGLKHPAPPEIKGKAFGISEAIGKTAQERARPAPEAREAKYGVQKAAAERP